MVIWFMTLCSDLVDSMTIQNFGGQYCFHFHPEDGGGNYSLDNDGSVPSRDFSFFLHVQTSVGSTHSRVQWVPELFPWW